MSRLHYNDRGDLLDYSNTILRPRGLINNSNEELLSVLHRPDNLFVDSNVKSRINYDGFL